MKDHFISLYGGAKNDIERIIYFHILSFLITLHLLLDNTVSLGQKKKI